MALCPSFLGGLSLFAPVSAVSLTRRANQSHAAWASEARAGDLANGAPTVIAAALAAVRRESLQQ